MNIVIEHIREGMRREIYEDVNLPGIFEFMTEHLHYSKGAASRRIGAARLGWQIPELTEWIKSGELNLSQITIFNQAVRKKESLSKERVDASEKRKILEAIRHMPVQAEQIVAKMLDIPIVKKTVPKIQQDGSMTGTYSLTPAQTALYNRLKMKMSHVNPNPAFEEAFEFAAKYCLSPETKKERRAAKKKAADASNSSPVTETENHLENPSPAREPTEFQRELDPKVTPVTGVEINPTLEEQQRTAKDPGYISPQTRREIEQEQPSCRWLYPDGTMCESEFQLQIDHIKSIWAGGDSRKSNLQRLCAIHNRKKYRLEANIHPH
jgi:polyhydroxyalkanoate synthesis regulator phasin